MIAATCHDRHTSNDYQRLTDIGISSARDGVRWHLVERSPFHYDWSSVLPMVQAGRAHGVQVIWDLCHYGWPDDLDIFRPEFVDRFQAFARAFAGLIFNETDETPYFAPMNEISFLAWGAGDKGFLHPFARCRGLELKCQLVRATIAAIDSIRDIVPHARFVQIDPMINVVTDADASEQPIKDAADYTHAQYEAYDMLAGYLWPQLGGDPRYLDILGANYYVHNQWVLNGHFIERADPRYRPLRELLRDLHTRYRKPLFIAETGIEDERRPEWLAYIASEVVGAIEQGIPVEGICLYPIVNHPGWDDERHCHNGLWDYCNQNGDREIYEPLVQELEVQFAHIERVLQRAESKQSSQHHSSWSLARKKRAQEFLIEPTYF